MYRGRWIFHFLSQLSFMVSLYATLEVADLSLEEKVGQLLMVHFHGQEDNEEARCLIQEAHVGGIIYYTWANGLTGPLQVRELSRGLQLMANQTSHRLPLFIAVDQEGGLVNRLKAGFTVFPGNYALGQTENWQWGEDSAWMTGQELQAVGVNVNLAPVVDVFSRSSNPVIGIRSFGADPEKVARWGQYMLKGYHKAGVLTALKHFPGHGDTQVDSHEALPRVEKTRAALEQVELVPFRTLAKEADMIMTAHLFVPAIDEEQIVTFSQKAVEQLLRKELNFSRVIVTDSLAMQGVLSQSLSLEEAALKSLEAGHDVILLGGKQLLASQNGFEITLEDVLKIHHFLVEAVKQGRLSEERLNQSVQRILDLKQRGGLFREAQPETTFDSSVHADLAAQIAQKALRLEKGQQWLPVNLSTQKILLVAPSCLQGELQQTAWTFPGTHHQVFYFKNLNLDAETLQQIEEATAGVSTCVYFAYNVWKYPAEQKLFHFLKRQVPLTIAIGVCDPQDQLFLAEADVLLLTFSPVSCALQAAYDYLTGGNSQNNQNVVHLPPALAQQIGLQIWQNECGRKYDGLTTWNQGEEFASLGIGHFIWYPENVPKIFQESFPELLLFLKTQGVILPAWLEQAKGCPWRKREDFQAAQNQQALRELRLLLVQNIDLQTLFMVQRLQRALPSFLTRIPVDKRAHIRFQFQRLAQTPAGIYALLDYLNFKGEGLTYQERYKGQGWGLLQVLERLQGTQIGRSAVEEFVVKAKEMLMLRVEHAPPERKEGRWLKGWFNRLDTYTYFAFKE